MNCRTCGYALWNLRTRQCPECGERFAPSEFEFVSNAVAFCCPYCDQAYYGTDENGHLVPREFACVKCGQLTNMDLMVVRPAEGVHENQTYVGSVPWIAPDEQEWLKPLLKTIWAALIRPDRLGMGMRPEQPIFQAWLFAAIVLGLTLFATFLPCMGFYGVLFSVMGAQGGGAAPGAFFMVIPLLVGLAFSFVVTLLGIVYWGAFAHLLLRLTGETSSSIGRTFECICYSSGANVASAVPCIGYYFGWIWWVISALFVVKEGQRVSTGRAALATLVPPGLALLALIAAYAGLMIFALGAAGTFAATGPPAPLAAAPTDHVTAARRLSMNLRALGWTGLPEHAAEMIPVGYASPAMFVTTSSETDLRDVPVGGALGASLRELETLDVAEQDRICGIAASQLPDNVIAHRVGDFVFTYHGIDMMAGISDPRLWMLIASPDPDSNEASAFNGYLVVADYQGNVQSVREDQFEEELTVQNRVRSQYGFAPLPHPREVTHGRPATGQE